MTSQGLWARLRQLYAKAATELQNWERLQASANSQLATCINVFQRLPALQDSSNYQGLRLQDSYQQLLLGKQLDNLEALLSGLAQTLAGCEAVMRALEKLALDANRHLQAERVASSASSCAVAYGAQPSLAQAIEGLQDIWCMVRDEVAVQKAIYGQLTFDGKPDDLDALQRLFAAHPNVNSAECRQILAHVMDSG